MNASRWRQAASRTGLQFGTVQAGNIRFGTVAAGPPEGPLALCLHGFPDHAFSWQFLLRRLAAAGWRAVAPWMRGYHPTGAAPDGCYQTGALALDAIALHEALSPDRSAVLIGHDWGAVAAYGAASAEPRRWSRVVTLAVPPRPAWLPSALAHPAQWRRSWYIFFFQVPCVPERVLGAGNLRTLDRLWTDWWSGYRSDVTFRSRLLGTFASGGTLANALAYYRSLTEPRRRHRREELAMLDAPPQPTLYLHGDEDDVVGDVYARRTAGVLAPGSSVDVVRGAGHFLHLQRPETVNDRILDFVGTAA